MHVNLRVKIKKREKERKRGRAGDERTGETERE